MRESETLPCAVPVLLSRREDDNGTRSDINLLILRRDRASTFGHDEHLLACVGMKLILYTLSEINLVDDKLLARLVCDDRL